MLVALRLGLERAQHRCHRLGSQAAVGCTPALTRARPRDRLLPREPCALDGCFEREPGGQRRARERRDLDGRVVRQSECLAKLVLGFDERAFGARQVGRGFCELALGQGQIERGGCVGIESRLHALEQLARGVRGLLGQRLGGDGQRHLHIRRARLRSRLVLDGSELRFRFFDDEAGFMAPRGALSGHVERNADCQRVGSRRSMGFADHGAQVEERIACARHLSKSPICISGLAACQRAAHARCSLERGLFCRLQSPTILLRMGNRHVARDAAAQTEQRSAELVPRTYCCERDHSWPV